MNNNAIQNILIHKAPQPEPSLWERINAELPEKEFVPARKAGVKILRVALPAVAAVFVFCAVAGSVYLLYPFQVGVSRDGIAGLNADDAYNYLPSSQVAAGVLEVQGESDAYENAGSQSSNQQEENAAGSVESGQTTILPSFQLPNIPAGGGDPGSISLSRFEGFQESQLKDACAAVQATVTGIREISRRWELNGEAHEESAYVYTLTVDKLIYTEVSSIKEGEPLTLEVPAGGSEDGRLEQYGTYVLPVADLGTSAVPEGAVMVEGNASRESRYGIVGSDFFQIRVYDDGGTGAYYFYSWYKSLLTGDAESLVFNGTGPNQTASAGDSSGEEAAYYPVMRYDGQFLQDYHDLIVRQKEQ